MSAFDDLRESTDPIAPDAAFAARLRRRVTDALHATGTTTDTTTDMTTDTTTDTTADPATADVPTVDLPERNHAMTDITTSSVAPTPAGTATLTPYIAVAGAAEAIAWYADVLGAVETVRYTGDDGRVGHAEVDIGGARLMLSDEYPDYDAVAPTTLGGTPTALHVDVPDVDAVWDRAIAQGATGKRPPEDQPYGDRSCTFVDPFGHRWMVATRIADPTTEEIQAAMTDYTITATGERPASDAPPVPVVELGYYTLGFEDTAQAARFYGALFGWEGEQGNAGEGYLHVANTLLPMGLTPDGSHSSPQLYFRVDSVERYAARVRELGGTVVSESTYASGADAVCRDDQGREFHLWQPAPGY